MFAPAEISTRRRYDDKGRQSFGTQSFNKTGFGDKTRGGATARQAPSVFGRDETYTAASAQLAAGPLHRGHRASIPRREALILQAALNHPWLLHEHLEEFAEAEFRHADTQKLKGALIDVFAHHFADDFGGRAGDAERAALAAELARRGFTELLGRIERSITTPSVWGARPQAAESDVLLTWKQLVALHRQWHSLTRELRDAETALGQDNTEANYARLCDVKARLSSLDGTEALVEGFGASSGRQARLL
jgi:DNA primase